MYMYGLCEKGAQGVSLAFWRIFTYRYHGGIKHLHAGPLFLRDPMVIKHQKYLNCFLDLIEKSLIIKEITHRSIHVGCYWKIDTFSMNLFHFVIFLIITCKIVKHSVLIIQKQQMVNSVFWTCLYFYGNVEWAWCEWIEFSLNDICGDGLYMQRIFQECDWAYL